VKEVLTFAEVNSGSSNPDHSTARQDHRPPLSPLQRSLDGNYSPLTYRLCLKHALHSRSSMLPTLQQTLFDLAISVCAAFVFFCQWLCTARQLKQLSSAWWVLSGPVISECTGHLHHLQAPSSGSCRTLCVVATTKQCTCQALLLFQPEIGASVKASTFLVWRCVKWLSSMLPSVPVLNEQLEAEHTQQSFASCLHKHTFQTTSMLFKNNPHYCKSLTGLSFLDQLMSKESQILPAACRNTLICRQAPHIGTQEFTVVVNLARLKVLMALQYCCLCKIRHTQIPESCQG